VYIQLMYTFYRVLGWDIRQITQDGWATRGLYIAVASSVSSLLRLRTSSRCSAMVCRATSGAW
jgi:hypothetical protein